MRAVKKTEKKDGQNAIIEALKALAKEKDISEELLFSAIEEALKAAYKKNLNKLEVAPANLSVVMNRETGVTHVYARKLIVPEVEEESSQISLRIVDGKVAFREADDKGFIPVNTIAELKMIDLDDASRGRKYLQQGNIDLLDAEWTPISKLEGIYDGGNFTVARLRVSLGNGNAGLFAANGGTIRNVVIASASALRGQWHAGMVCGENTGTIERCTNRASVTDGGSNTLGGICGYNNNGTVSECLNTGTLTIDATVPSDGTGGIVGYCGKGTITGCGNTGGIGGKPSKTGGIAGQADDCQIADCYNTGDLVLPWGAGDNNGGIAGLTYNAHAHHALLQYGHRHGRRVAGRGYLRPAQRRGDDQLVLQCGQGGCQVEFGRHRGPKHRRRDHRLPQRRLRDRGSACSSEQSGLCQDHLHRL